jgi:hypothetical protein
MRSRGSGAAQVYTPDTIAEQFGVVRSSYTGVALPPRQVLTVMCRCVAGQAGVGGEGDGGMLPCGFVAAAGDASSRHTAC